MPEISENLSEDRRSNESIHRVDNKLDSLTTEGINTKTFLIMQLNINGCSSATTQSLNQYINKHQADLVMLSETKSTDLEDKHFNNYQVLLKPNIHNATQRGGVAILIPNYINVNRLSTLENDYTDATFINTAVGGRRLLLGSVYIPPNQLQTLSKVNEQIRNANDKLGHLKCEHLIVLGDFNARHPNWNDRSANNHGKELVEFCSDTNLCVPDM